MSDDAFIHSLLHAPNDDALRLVYADWLEEQGDLRADFLRLECQVAKLIPGDPRYPVLQNRLVEISQRIDLAWLIKVSRLKKVGFPPSGNGEDDEDQCFCPAFEKVISIGLCWECSMADQGGPTDTAAELRRWVAASGRFQSVAGFQTVCADCVHCPWRGPGAQS